MVRVGIVDILLGAVGGFVVGWFSGHALGVRVQRFRPWRYWVLNAAALFVGATLNVVGLSVGKTWLWVGAIAFIVASLSGLKYGRGVTTGSGSLQPPFPRELGPPSLWDD
jgi:hypothetical protein